MGKNSLIDKTTLVLFLISVLSLLIFKSLNIVLVIFFGALAGIFIVNTRKMLLKYKMGRNNDKFDDSEGGKQV